ncbi:hypothetical protein QQZ08_007623 [Neonectria magnoliae]|uniref:Uncharacterized protein n=1 Tax=Neonectria magnoliae TaxID=2732573 RepID=A0ABR1HY65_9HYPO
MPTQQVQLQELAPFKKHRFTGQGRDWKDRGHFRITEDRLTDLSGLGEIIC